MTDREIRLAAERLAWIVGHERTVREHEDIIAAQRKQIEKYRAEVEGLKSGEIYADEHGRLRNKDGSFR